MNKKPLTQEEQDLIKSLSNLIPLFEEIAKDTWPEIFESNICSNLRSNVFDNVHPANIPAYKAIEDLKNQIWSDVYSSIKNAAMENVADYVKNPVGYAERKRRDEEINERKFRSEDKFR